MAEDIRLEIARKQIEFARGYTLSLLEDIEDDDWFRGPSEGVTHFAWQVGHLAMAEYGLCLFRQRGRQPIDGELMSSSFRKKFSKGTIPDPDPAGNPAPAEILDTLNRVHVQVMEELPRFDAQELDVSVDEPHAVFDTKLGALFFCADHEMLHAGQIGLLRRLMGKQPIR